MTEAETRISALEDQDQSLSDAVETTTKTIAQLQEVLDIEMGPDFEIERAHRAVQRGNRDRHILMRFLRFGAREAVLRAAREKERVEWRGKHVSCFQDL